MSRSFSLMELAALFATRRASQGDAVQRSNLKSTKNSRRHAVSPPRDDVPFGIWPPGLMYDYGKTMRGKLKVLKDAGAGCSGDTVGKNSRMRDRFAFGREPHSKGSSSP